MKSVRFNSLASLVMAVALTIGLAACGGGSDTKPPAETGPTLAERQAAQQSAIDTASTAVTTALANLSGTMPTQAQVDALDTAVMQLSMAITAAVDVSDSAKGTANGQLAFAQNAATTAKANIDATARAGRAMTQQSAIVTASVAVTAALTALGDPEMATHTDQALVDALNEAITELDGAITVAVDVDDLTAANAALTAARTDAMTAQTKVTASRTAEMNSQQDAIESALAHIHVAVTAIEDAGDMPTQAQVDDLVSAIMMLRAAIDGAAYVADLTDARATLARASAIMMTAASTVSDNMSSEAQRQTDAIGSASDAVTNAHDALDDPPTQAQVDALESAIEMLEDAIDDADEVSAAVLSTANALVNSAKSAHTLAQAAYDAKMEADRIAAQKVLNAAAMLVGNAIRAHGPVGNPPNEFSFTDTDTTTGGVQALTVTRGSGAAKITPFQSAADKKTKPFMTGTAPDAGTGWSGTTFMRSGTAAKKAFTEKATVYTDIEAAASQLWAMRFGTTTPVLGITLGDVAGILTLALTGGETGPTLDATRFTGGILPGAPAADDDETDRVLSAGGSTSGTFYGVPGVFACTTTDCTVTRNDDGEVMNTGGTLTFTPTTYDADTTMAKYATPDVDYTQFGYWMKSTKQRDGSYMHDIETFHGGRGTVATDLSTIEGFAKYYGAAAGVYVKSEGADDSLVVKDGNFTADAMLTADFAGGGIAMDAQRMISGTISGFMDGSEDLGFASLTLEKADFEVTAGTVATFSGETNGGGTSGNWSGQFHGNAGSATLETSDDFPANVSGEFNGHFNNGYVAGAFGAEKD